MYVFCMSEALCVRLHIYFNLQPPMIKTNFFFTVPSVHDLAGVDPQVTCGQYAGTSTPGKIGNCLIGFPFVNNLSHCRTLRSRFFSGWWVPTLLLFSLGIVLNHKSN